VCAIDGSITQFLERRAGFILPPPPSQHFEPRAIPLLDVCALTALLGFYSGHPLPTPEQQQTTRHRCADTV
jgi:hypothetical protein